MRWEYRMSNASKSRWAFPRVYFIPDKSTKFESNPQLIDYKFEEVHLNIIELGKALKNLVEVC